MMNKNLVLTLALQIGTLSMVSGQTNLITLSELDSAKCDWPKTITVTTNISVAGQLGSFAIQRGEKLSILSVNRGKISVLPHVGTTNDVSTDFTDIVEQINTLRSHRLIVGKEQYEDCRIEKCNPAEAKIFHRSGIATVSIAKLPPEIQKQLGYDPTTDAGWRADQQQKQAAVESAKVQAYLNEHTYTVKYMEAAMNQIPFGKDIMVSGIYGGAMDGDDGINNGSTFWIKDGNNHMIKAACITGSESFNILLNARRNQKFMFIGQKQNVGYDRQLFVVQMVRE